MKFSAGKGRQVPPFAQGADKHGLTVCCCVVDDIPDESFASLAVVKARTATTIVGTKIHAKKICNANEKSTSFFRFPFVPVRF